MRARPDILCIGAALWDVIGRIPGRAARGDDLPGAIRRSPGGVALNLAAACAREGLAPALLAALGEDPEGAALAAAAEGLGIDMRFAQRLPGRRTDRYLAIEDAAGLVAAVADAGTLEAAGFGPVAPLADGRLASAATPWDGPVLLDGNLAPSALADLAGGPLLAAADLRLVASAPAKAGRLGPFLGHPRATLYLNRAEAAALAGRPAATAAAAAAALRALGVRRAVVTDGAGPAADLGPEGRAEALPPPVVPRRVTGAGDAFVAAHVAADLRGAPPGAALAAGLAAAARWVAGAD